MMRDQRVYAAGAAAVKVSQSQTAAAHLISSDEAPDTGDDSDDDLITNYLGGGHPGGNGAGGGAIPSIHLTSSQASNTNHILEDNLVQLAEIHENIQRMRVENASSSRLLGLSKTSSGKVAAERLSVIGGGGVFNSSSNRLSTSCPSLNNDESLENSINNNLQASAMGNESNASTSGPYHAVTPTSSASNRAGRKSNRSNLEKDKGKSKRHAGRQQRSLSVSSGDSDDPSFATASSHHSGVVSYRPPVGGHHHHHHHPHHLRGGGGGMQDSVDGYSSYKNRQRSSSSVAVGIRTGESSSAGVVYDHGGVFKTPEPVSKPRAPSRSKSPHFLAQFPVLHKSISTPSIVVDQQHPHRGGHGKSYYPEPTHVFLKKLISEHEWTRRSGSDTDSEDDVVGGVCGGGSSGGHVSVVGHGAGGLEEARRLHGGSHQRLHHGGNESAPSPQLSLAEFLKDVPNSVEDDDQRKRRRKKERSSLFFRKKKDKSASKTSVSGPSAVLPSGIISGSSMMGFGAGVGSGGIGDVNARNLAKAPSAVSIANKPSQGRMPQHSYSMSSLRKATAPAGGYMSGVGGAGGGGGAAPYSGSLSGPVQIAPQSSNFYLARGEISKINQDDRDDLTQEDTAGLLEGEFIPGAGDEFGEGGGPAAIRNLDTDPFLRIQDDEPENWQQSQQASPELMQALTPMQVKRQEHIYEFIATESNHCQVLKVIQKLFVDGMYQHLNMPKEIVDRIFPFIDELIELHFKFLEKLRYRQKEQTVVDTIADILLEQFSGPISGLWKEAYGALSSQNNESLSLYKDLMKSDRRFQQFVRSCANNPLLKKKGIPECILFVTTRITKYPLLIDPLIKTARDRPQEQQKLKDANMFVREILKDVNAKVAEKEREQRFLDIYKAIDAKSSVLYNGKKFKKSDVLQASRKLMFEGVGVLQLQPRHNRSVQVVVVVLSDIMFFLQENNGKYYFVAMENRPSVVPAHTLLARERPGVSSTKSLHIISMPVSVQATEEPELYEVEIQQPPTREDWISGIREAVDACSYDEGQMLPSSSLEEARRFVDAKYMRLRHLTAELRGKDLDLARTFEDKMRIVGDMLVVAGGRDAIASAAATEDRDYLSLVREREEEEGGGGCTKEQLLDMLNEATKSASMLTGLGPGGINLARSVSSVGERHSADFASPALPQRAETFGGFDQQNQPLTMTAKTINLDENHELSVVASSGPPSTTNLNNAQATPQQQMQEQQQQQHEQSLLHMDPERQEVAVNLMHCLHSMSCMVSEHFTSLESLKTELSEIREKSSVMGGRYKHNQQLQELRSLEERLGQEKKQWQAEKESLEAERKEKEKEMARAQSEIERGLKDVKEQRDQLYRKLDLLKAQGIEIIGPNMAVLKTEPQAHHAGHGHGHGEVLYYSEDRAAAAAAAAAAGGTMDISPAHVGGGGGGTLPGFGHHGLQVSASTSSLRRSSAHAVGSVQGHPANAGLVSSGSSVSNLNLISTSNEVKGEKPEVRQQIPVKLSSKLSVSSGGSTKDRSRKSVAGLGKAANLSSASSLSGSMGNIAKPIVEGSNIQQMLPFKLSQKDGGTGSSTSSSGHSNSMKKAGSPRMGYQKLTAEQHHHQQQLHHHYPQPQQPQQQQQQQHSDGVSHQRTGSSPAQMPLPPGSTAGPRVVNTLPKNSGGGGGGSDHSRDDANSYNNSGEDKVIYF